MVTVLVAEKWHATKATNFKHTPQKISTLRGMLYFTKTPYIMVSLVLLNKSTKIYNACALKKAPCCAYYCIVAMQH